jgi:lipoprotein-anchoring transpeptidase ErfK/SrfK
MPTAPPAAAVSADGALPPPAPGVPGATPAVPAAPQPPISTWVPTVPVPANSGAGRRIIYDMGTMHVWLIEADGSVARDYPVSGHKYRTLPGTGQFWVYSKSRYTGVAHSPTRMEYMVRFALGESGTGIGFHDIPTKRGKAIESVKNLGQPASHGCVRQSEPNAIFLWNWAPIGTIVNVIDTTGHVRPAKPGRFPRGVRPLTPMERLASAAQLVTTAKPQ